MFQESTQQGHEAVVVAEAAAVAGVGGAVVAAEGAAKGVEEDGGALGGEPIMVAVGGIVATGHLGRVAVHIVDLLQEVDIGRGLAAVGVDDHQTLVAATEEVDIDKQLDFTQLYQRVVNEIMRPHKARLLAAEEQEDIGIVSALQVGHAGQVHDGSGAAGVVVSAVEDGVATHAEVLVVGGEDNHGVHFARDVSADILRDITGVDDGRLGAGLGEAEVLKVVLAERLHTVGHQLGAQVVGRDGVASVLHATAEHLLAAEVADDATRIGAVLRLQGEW